MEFRIKIEKNIALLALFLYTATMIVWDYTSFSRSSLLIFVVVAFLYDIRSFFKPKFYIISSLLFIAYFYGHTLLGHSVDSSLSYDTLSTLDINLLAAMAITGTLKDKELFHRVMRCWIYVSLIMCFYILLKDYKNIFSGNLGTYVPKPITGGPYSHNDIPVAAGLSIMFLSYFEITNKRVKYSLLMKVFFLAYITLTGARKALLFGIIGFIIYPYFLSGKREYSAKKVGKILLGCGIIAILFVFIMKNETLYNIIGYRLEAVFEGMSGGEYTESSAITRNIMKETILELIKEKPIIGYGLDTFRTFDGSFYAWSHVNYYEILQSGGVVALIIYYSYMVYALIKLIKYRKDLMGAMMLSLLLYLFMHDALSVSYMTRSHGFMLSMINAYIVIMDEERKERIKTYQAMREIERQNQIS